MLIKTTTLKKMMKAAARVGALHVWTGGGSLLISGTYWAVRIKKEILTHKDKAMLIELIGEYPEDGTGFVMDKDGEQIPEYDIPSMMCALETPEEELVPLKETILSMAPWKLRMLQAENGTIYAVSEDILSGVKGAEINQKYAESAPEEILTDGSKLYWDSRQMRMAVEKVSLFGYKDMISYLERMYGGIPKWRGHE